MDIRVLKFFWSGLNFKQKCEFLKNLFQGYNNYILQRGSCWIGKKHKIESKIKQRNKALNRNIIKDKNPMFGKIWIHNDILKCNKIIDKNDILDLNWKYGRIMKYSMYKAKQL